ncbi:MAG: hypothetical protein ACR2K2_03075 [Mycobacteriales bacterium]
MYATDLLLDVLRGCAVLGRFAAFENLLSSWEASAQLWSDPALAAAVSAPIVVPHGGDVDEPGLAPKRPVKLPASGRGR